MPKIDTLNHVVFGHKENHSRGSEVNRNAAAGLLDLSKIKGLKESNEKVARTSHGAAPELDLPTFSQFALLRTMNEARSARMETVTTQIECTKAEQEEMHREVKRQIDKALKAIKKAMEQMEKSKDADTVSRVFGCIGAGLMVVAAGCAVAATGGAAAPLVAVAVIMCVQTIGSEISMASGGPRLSLSERLIQVTELTLETAGFPKDFAKSHAPIVAAAVAAAATGGWICAVSPELMGAAAQASALECLGASEKEAMIIGLIVTIGAALYGAKVMAGASKAGTVAETGSKLAQLRTASHVAAAVAQATAAGTSIGKSVHDIKGADAKYDADQANALAEKLNAPSEKLKDFMKDAQEELEEIFKNTREFYGRITEMMQAQYELNLKINSYSA